MLKRQFSGVIVISVRTLLLSITLLAAGVAYSAEPPVFYYYGDFNGDGEVDVMISPEERLTPISLPIAQIIARPLEFDPLIIWSAGLVGESVQRLEGTSFLLRQSFIAESTYSGQVFEQDFDGDGSQDLFVQAGAPGYPSYQWFSYRQSYLDVRSVEELDGLAIDAGSALITFNDFNNDGRADISITPVGGVSVYTFYSDVSGDWPELSAVSVDGGDPEAEGLLFMAAAVAAATDVNKGSSSFSIPISLAPGSAGVAPELSIQYSSDAGYSYLGMGASISGFDTISRCARDYLRNGAYVPVKYDSSDGLCMGGVPLVLVSGTNLQNGAEYRTETSSYQKIVFHGTASSGWFEVFTKDGLVKRYGETFTSALYIDGVKAQWALDRVGDRTGAGGTYYTIEYVVTAPGTLPKKIVYSKNDSESAVDGYAEVLFEYKADSYEQKYYRHGQSIDYTGLLASVTNTLDSEVVAEYIFSYSKNPLTGRSRLEKIYQCGKNSYCALPTVLTWSTGGGPDFDVAVTSMTSTERARVAVGHSAWVDMDRDGDIDYCRLEGIGEYEPIEDRWTFYTYIPRCTVSDGNSFVANIDVNRSYPSGDLPGASAQWVDANADGFVDYCYLGAVSPDMERMRCYFSNQGQSFDSTLTYIDIPRGYGSDKIGTRYWVDINADGAVDSCIAYSLSSKKRFSCAVNESDAANPVFSFAPHVELGEIWRHTRLNFVDVNADSYPDICYGQNNDLRCVLNIGGVSLGEIEDPAGPDYWVSMSASAGSEMRRQFVDFNGDGYLDWCRVVSDDGYRGRCTLGTGTGWGEEITSQKVFIGGEVSIWTDINDDGRVDWCRNYADRIRCLLSGGKYFSHEVVSGPAQIKGEVFIEDNVSYGSVSDGETTFTDVDGDGLMEFCQFSGGTSPAGIDCYFTENQEFSD